MSKPTQRDESDRRLVEGCPPIKEATDVAKAGPRSLGPPSCAWKSLEVAACTDGTLRLLVNGRRATREEWDAALAAARGLANQATLLKLVYDAGTITAPELAEHAGIALTAASMRLKTAHGLGVLAREQITPNGGGILFRYSLKGAVA